MKLSSARAVKKARVEIIPLIDIMFFLLATFVMVSLSMVQNKGVSVKLPSATSGTPQERRDSAAVSVTAGGEIFFNRQPVSLEALASEIIRLKQETAEPTIFINGDTDARFGTVISVMDTIRASGVQKISFETRPATDQAVIDQRSAS